MMFLTTVVARGLPPITRTASRSSSTYSPDKPLSSASSSSSSSSSASQHARLSVRSNGCGSAELDMNVSCTPTSDAAAANMTVFLRQPEQLLHANESKTEAVRWSAVNELCVCFLEHRFGNHNVSAADRSNDCPELAQNLTAFHSQSLPALTVGEYFRHLLNLQFSSAATVLAMVYLSRVKQRMRITAWNIHRLLVTSVMLASKFHDDRHYNNAAFAKIGGLAASELNELELELLELLDYSLAVDPLVYAATYRALCEWQHTKPTWPVSPPLLGPHAATVLAADPLAPNAFVESSNSSSSSRMPTATNTPVHSNTPSPSHSCSCRPNAPTSAAAAPTSDPMELASPGGAMLPSIPTTKPTPVSDKSKASPALTWLVRRPHPPPLSSATTAQQQQQIPLLNSTSTTTHSTPSSGDVTATTTTLCRPLSLTASVSRTSCVSSSCGSPDVLMIVAPSAAPSENAVKVHANHTNHVHLHVQRSLTFSGASPVPSVSVVAEPAVVTDV